MTDIEQARQRVEDSRREVVEKADAFECALVSGTDWETTMARNAVITAVRTLREAEAALNRAQGGEG